MGLFRLLLAIAVLISHTITPTLGGWSYVNPTVAVEIFFVISGFYIQMVLAEKYRKNLLGSHWITKFYVARYFRLFPAYFVCLVLSILYFLVIKKIDLGSYYEIPNEYIKKVFELPITPRNILLWIWFMFSNVFMFFQDFSLLIYVVGKQSFFSLRELGGDFYLPNAMLIPQAWSIGIEILFYLVAPLILGLKTRYLLLVGGFLLLAKIIIIFLEPHDVINMRFWYETFPTLVQKNNRSRILALTSAGDQILSIDSSRSNYHIFYLADWYSGIGKN